ncbi:MAG: hypothetical protein JWQ96_1369 [Segetibacter sp.]|nr:hypothetical protein [Segetibacter sp.]
MKKQKIYIVFLLVTVCSVFTLFASAQSIKASMDREKILIGEQIQLKLTVENAKGLKGWFNLPDSVNHIEVVERQKIDTIQVGSITNYQQTISITSFDSGQWQIPALSVPGVGQKIPPLTIYVLPVDVSQMKDYHDIKDIVEVKTEINWLIVGIIAFLTLAALIALFILFKKMKAKVPAAAAIKVGNLSPLAWAMQELDKLKQEALYQSNHVKQHYDRLTDIARNYFVLQMQHPSMHITTDEWMIRLQALPVESSTKTSFFQLLRLSDTVKFAKYLPPAEENERSIDTAKEMLQHVNALQQQIQSSSNYNR